MANESENILLRIQLDSGETIKKVADLKIQIDSLKESNKQLAKEAKAANEAGNAASYELLTQKISGNNVAIKNLTDTQRNLNNVLNIQQKERQAQSLRSY